MLCLDGLASYITAFIKIFRHRYLTGQRGDEEAILAVLQRTQTREVTNTAYIERLNATFRAHLALLARNPRAISRRVETVNCATYLVDCAYNFLLHDTLSCHQPLG